MEADMTTTTAQTRGPTVSSAQKPRKPLRVWPGVVIVALQWLARFGVPVVVPGTVIFGVFSGLIGGALIVLWWLFFSRAPWSERLVGVGLMGLGLVVTPLVLHESIATAGMGMLFPIYAVPTLSLAFVAWAVLCRGLAEGPRYAAMVAAALLGCGVWALLRTGGVRGDFDWDFAWRWEPTPEQRLLAEAGDEVAALPTPPPAAEAAAEGRASEAGDETAPEPVPPAGAETTEPDEGDLDQTAAAPPAAAPTPMAADWPGFRGAGRDARVAGVRIATDWSASPPVELWRRPVGPGWSSFAVDGDRLYTQEQRGEDEVVACYDATTGEPVWGHRDPVRFWEAMAGAGPRATPTIADGRVYAFGATGILNVLDAESGAVVWSRNAATDTDKKVPGWGFASSPLVTGDLVVVAVSSQLAAYDRATGEPRWVGPAGGGESYSSPHLLEIDGVPQIVLLDGAGATSVALADGAVLWEHPWPGFNSLQPGLTAEGDLLVTSSSSSVGLGTRRIAVEQGPDGWTVEERWTSIGLKPYFNDFVVHEGHAYGFDGRILSCIDLDDGERKWKGGRFGHGQLVLLPDQDLLLVLSEKGELALIGATPDQFTEIARIPAIEGKTWNHPVLVGDLLLARNDHEMVAFRLALAGG
jgi:outer membrane protein assembly factor BamB